MDKSKKIMIGAIGTVVVAGGVIIGLILGRTPPKADLSTIHTEASTEAPAENKPQETKAPETEPSRIGNRHLCKGDDLYLRKGIH